MPEDGGLIGQALIGLKPVNAWVHTYTKSQTPSTRSRGLGWRIHESVEDTKLSTNKQHSLSTAYEYAPSANYSVDRRSASSQRRVRQQDAYRVFPRDPHALGVDTGRLRGRPQRVLRAHVELDRSAAWTRLGVRLGLRA